MIIGKLGIIPASLKILSMARKQETPMPFYVGDWLRCPELRVLPPDVRGLWMDMLCYMWESVERGVMVMPNGQPCTKEDIARIIGTDCSGSSKWVDSLIENKVCEVREDGAIYSRRMVKDNLISEKRRLAGKKGGEITKARVFIPKAEAETILQEQPQQPQQEVLLFPQESPPPLTPEQQKKAEKAKKYKYAEFVTLTRDEYAKLCAEYSQEGAKRMIEILDNYKGSKGKKYSSDYRAILNWVVNRYNEEIQKYGYKHKESASKDPGSATGNDYRNTI